MDRGAATALRRWAPQCGCSLVGKSCMGEAGTGHRLRPRWTCHLGSRVWRASGVIGRGTVAPRNLCVKEGASGGERVKGGAEPPRCEWRGWGRWPRGLGREAGEARPQPLSGWDPPSLCAQGAGWERHREAPAGWVSPAGTGRGFEVRESTCTSGPEGTEGGQRTGLWWGGWASRKCLDAAGWSDSTAGVGAVMRPGGRGRRGGGGAQPGACARAAVPEHRSAEAPPRAGKLRPAPPDSSLRLRPLPGLGSAVRGWTLSGGCNAALSPAVDMDPSRAIQHEISSLKGAGRGWGRGPD